MNVQCIKDLTVCIDFTQLNSMILCSFWPIVYHHKNESLVMEAEQFLPAEHLNFSAYIRKTLLCQSEYELVIAAGTWNFIYLQKFLSQIPKYCTHKTLNSAHSSKLTSDVVFQCSLIWSHHFMNEVKNHSVIISLSFCTWFVQLYFKESSWYISSLEKWVSMWIEKIIY